MNQLSPRKQGVSSLPQCSESNLTISGGDFTLSKMYIDGSILRYHCPEGYYPHPVKLRQCYRGRWDPAPTRKQPECKRVTCPNPNVLNNGIVDPYKRIYYMNDTTTFRCHSDYTFRGSSTRVCQANGKWSGGTPVCSRNSDHCPDPGIPPGASRTGHIFNIDDAVTYRCHNNLKLLGSKVRVCQDDGQWSGQEPECYADFTYDTPEEVAEAFSSSLQTTLTMNEETDKEGKRIKLEQGGKLNIYIALDASDSIEEEDFNKAKNIIKQLIIKVRTVMVALLASYCQGKLIVLVSLSAGVYNEGGNPSKNVKEIKQIVYNGQVEKRDEYLDLYVFGVGDDVQREDIDDWVTKKRDEKHFFLLQDMENVEETFDQMIDESTSVSLCGLYKDYHDGTQSTMRRGYPWLIKIDDGTVANCLGSLVTPTFILTAAHCFRFGDIPENIKVGAPNVRVKEYIPHPKFQIRDKEKEGISEFYEYDVALIELEKSVIIGIDLRTICIPCTKETSGALRLSSSGVTCKHHKEELMNNDLVTAKFMSSKKMGDVVPKKNVQIKEGYKRASCIEDAKKELNITDEQAAKIITDNFLCTGGAELNQVDDISCKDKTQSIETARDFHTNLFSPEVQAFLKKYLGDGKRGAPLTFL
uniref:C3/C5 convertase n=1 Tax=Electrophorus electricus TaxID=8005 RepID=A0AAY5F406_ELEEL